MVPSVKIRPGLSALLLLLVLVATGTANVANAQTVVELLQERRLRAVANQTIEEEGQLQNRRPDNLPVSVSFLSEDSVAVVSQEVESFDIFKVRRIPKLGRGWFEEQFPQIDWVFLGSNDLSRIDTTFTWQLRGMLEAEFGAPTQTLTDFGYWRTLESEQFIQFEYWFVINNQIPLVVTDVNGPFERGLVVATDYEFAADLHGIRNALLDPLLESNSVKPYIDYYYDEEFDTWYLTGVEDDELFARKISTSQIGNTRPVLPPR